MFNYCLLYYYYYYYYYYLNLTDYSISQTASLQGNVSREADSSSGSQEIAHMLWNRMFITVLYPDPRGFIPHLSILEDSF
jgi:hypothetical protein